MADGQLLTVKDLSHVHSVSYTDSKRVTEFQRKDYPFLGRIKNTKTVVRTSNIQSKQMGRRENKICNTEGRVQFDLLQVFSFFS